MFNNKEIQNLFKYEVVRDNFYDLWQCLLNILYLYLHADIGNKMIY